MMSILVLNKNKNNMNKITEKLSEIFTEKQIQVLKDAWRFGAWGDAEVNFGKDEDDWGLGACTNDAKDGGHFNGRQISGIMSGISKKIDATHTDMVANFPDWWGDGTGDMVFFNARAFGYENSNEFWDVLNEWSKSND